MTVDQPCPECQTLHSAKHGEVFFAAMPAKMISGVKAALNTRHELCLMNFYFLRDYGKIEMKILIRNQTIQILPKGKVFDCTLKNANRFAGVELESVRIEDDHYAPYSSEFGRVCAYLKSRVQSTEDETPKSEDE